jgi:hypothetical protein
MLQRLFTSLYIALSVASISPVSAVPHQTAMLQSNPTAELPKYYEKSSLGGIKFEMTEQQLLKLYGKPLKRTIIKTLECGEYPKTSVFYTYRNIKVELVEVKGVGIVTMAETTNRRYLTDKGIRVGDSIKKAQAAYADLQRYPSGSTWTSENFLYLMKTNKREIITEISLGYNSGC